MATINRRRLFQDLIKVLVGLALLVVSLWGVDWVQLNESVAKVQLLWLLGTIGTVFLGLLLKIVRSFMLLRNFGISISFSRIAEAFFLGQAVNFLLPSRPGDVLRIGYLSVGQASLFPQVAAAVMLEKFLDLIAITVTSLIVLAYLPEEKVLWVKSWLLPLTMLAFAGLLIIIIFGPRISSIIRPWMSQARHKWGKKILLWINQLIDSSLWLRHPQNLVFPILTTAFVWVVMWWTNMVLFQGFSYSLPLIAGGLALILAYIGVLPNLMPGNVGPFYFFVRLALEPFNLSQEEGLAYTVLLHAVITMPPMIAAGFSMLVSRSVRSSFVKLWKPSG